MHNTTMPDTIKAINNLYIIQNMLLLGSLEAILVLYIPINAIICIIIRCYLDEVIRYFVMFR